MEHDAPAGPQAAKAIDQFAVIADRRAHRLLPKPRPYTTFNA